MHWSENWRSGIINMICLAFCVNIYFQLELRTFSNLKSVLFCPINSRDVDEYSNKMKNFLIEFVAEYT